MKNNWIKLGALSIEYFAGKPEEFTKVPFDNENKLIELLMEDFFTPRMMRRLKDIKAYNLRFEIKDNKLCLIILDKSGKNLVYRSWEVKSPELIDLNKLNEALKVMKDE